MTDEAALRLATTIRQACIGAARTGYEDAALSGLCHEGAMEAAISAIQMLDLEVLIFSSSKR